MTLKSGVTIDLLPVLTVVNGVIVIDGVTGREAKTLVCARNLCNRLDVEQAKRQQ